MSPAILSHPALSPVVEKSEISSSRKSSSSDELNHDLKNSVTIFATSLGSVTLPSGLYRTSIENEVVLAMTLLSMGPNLPASASSCILLILPPCSILNSSLILRVVSVLRCLISISKNSVSALSFCHALHSGRCCDIPLISSQSCSSSFKTTLLKSLAVSLYIL